MAVEMSNEQIIEEFGQLFGDEEPEETDEVENEGSEEESEEDTEESDDESSDEEESEDEPDDEEKPEDKHPAKKKSGKKEQQNYAFAQQRQQIKEQKAFIANISKLMGMDSSDPDAVMAKAQEVLLAKQSKETGIPAEFLQRLQVAETLVAENQAIKRRSEVQTSVTELIEKYDLDNDATDSFMHELIDAGKNPLEVDGVDIEAEYLKLHFNDIVQKAVSNAVDKEQKRQKKVKDNSASGAGESPGDASEVKVDSVADLDKLFGSMEL